MASNYSLKYDVDIVMCIDATGSMTGILDTVKRNALNFYGDVRSAMQEKGKQVNTLRVKVIAFRDYIADGDNAMLATEFYTMPKDEAEFSNLVKSINAEGGGDDPEDGLEALAYAIKSDWTTEGMKKRQVIVVWSDDGTHELGFGSRSPYYPKGMAKDMHELTAWWGDRQQPGFMDNNAKRLLLFTPDKPGWSTISQNWDNVLHFPSEAGNGLSNVEYVQIIDAISNTI